MQQTVRPTAHRGHPAVRLPQPSAHHATCAWCRAEFATIVALIDHVETAHVAATPQAA
jgi:hypothetical protein